MADGKCQMADDRGRMVNDEWQMADDECQVADDEIQVANEQREVESGGCDEGESSEPMAEGSFGPVVGHDSHGVIEESTNDKIGNLSHEGTHAADGVCQGDGLEHGLVCGVKTPQKAPNEAKLNSAGCRDEPVRPSPGRDRRQRSGTIPRGPVACRSPSAATSPHGRSGVRQG